MKKYTRKKPYAGKGKTREIFSQNLKRLRIKNNIIQVKLAKKVGVSLQAIKNFEHKRLFPSERTLEALSKALKTEVYLLLKPSRRK